MITNSKADIRVTLDQGRAQVFVAMDNKKFLLGLEIIKGVAVWKREIPATSLRTVEKLVETNSKVQKALFHYRRKE